MARLTISIPDELYGRLERWRERLNISRVCQEALDRELRRLEELPTDAEALGELVDRFSREKADIEQRWFAQGVTDGMTWSRGAAYVDLRAVVEGEIERTPSARAAVGDLMAGHELVPGFEPDRYLAGWHFAAGEVWRRVKAKI